MPPVAGIISNITHAVSSSISFLSDSRFPKSICLKSGGFQENASLNLADVAPRASPVTPWYPDLAEITFFLLYIELILLQDR